MNISVSAHSIKNLNPYLLVTHFLRYRLYSYDPAKVTEFQAKYGALDALQKQYDKYVNNPTDANRSELDNKKNDFFKHLENDINYRATKHRFENDPSKLQRVKWYSFSSL